MTPDEMRSIMEWLRERVRLEGDGEVAVRFDAPTAEEMAAAGLDAEGARRIRQASWWNEMVADIVETPEMCEPDEPREQVLTYARDVVSEYLRKRADL